MKILQNGIQKTLPTIPNYRDNYSIPTTSNTHTVTEDIYINYIIDTTSSNDYTLYVDNYPVTSCDTFIGAEGTCKIWTFSGFVKKGSVLKTTCSTGTPVFSWSYLKAWKLSR